MLRTRSPLFVFGFHRRGYLEEIARRAIPEPWGNGLWVLKSYLQGRFDMGSEQARIFENREAGLAAWDSGLLTPAGEPILLVYEPNRRLDQPWFLSDACVGQRTGAPAASSLRVSLWAPEFDPERPVAFNETHIMRDPGNRDRLQRALVAHLGSRPTDHLAFRLVYGAFKIENKGRDGVRPQWYRGRFQHLMPLRLGSAEQVDLVATIVRRDGGYEVKTLLPLEYAYPHARVAVPDRAHLPEWLRLSEQQLRREDRAGLGNSNSADHDDS